MQDVIHRRGLPWNRMVRAEYQLADTNFGSQVPQRLRCEHERVEVHLAQVLSWLLLELDACIHIRRDAQCVVGSSCIRRQIPATVCGAELQARKLVQSTFEDQMRQGDRRIQGIADRIGQPAVASEAMSQLGRALRMNEDEHAELLRFRPEWMELGVRELLTGNACANCCTA